MCPNITQDEKIESQMICAITGFITCDIDADCGPNGKCCLNSCGVPTCLGNFKKSAS